jgi:hypothetical protein
LRRCCLGIRKCCKMEAFNRGSQQSVYFGVGYVIASEWSSETVKRLDFQRALAENQLDFPRTSSGARDFTFVRTEQSPLQVKVSSLGPRVSSLSVSSERPVYSLELFGKEAEAICDAYRQTWLKEQCQILQCNATVRHLYSCKEHAFKYLWEDRLGQDPQDFRHLGGRAVLGGGLRLFMPPLKDDKEPLQIEVKIESYLRESQKMLIETLFVWPQPRLLSPDAKFDPSFRLRSVESYAAVEVCNFVVGREREE